MIHSLSSLVQDWGEKFPFHYLNTPVTTHTHLNKKVSQRRDFDLCAHATPIISKEILTREDFDLGLCASHHLKNNPPKGRIHKRWDKNPVQEILPEGRIIDRILLIEGYLHVSTFYSALYSAWIKDQNVARIFTAHWAIYEHYMDMCTSHKDYSTLKSSLSCACLIIFNFNLLTCEHCSGSTTYYLDGERKIRKKY